MKYCLNFLEYLEWVYVSREGPSIPNVLPLLEEGDGETETNQLPELCTAEHSTNLQQECRDLRVRGREVGTVNESSRSDREVDAPQVLVSNPTAVRGENNHQEQVCSIASWENSDDCP